MENNMLGKDFIKNLCEEQIQSTDLALSVEKMSGEIQSMVQKVTDMKTKDLSMLVKKIKFDNDINKAEGFEQSIGEKLDQAITALSDVKSSLDNDTVRLFNGEDPGSDDMSAPAGDELSDIDQDFGGEDFGDEEESDEDTDLDFSGLDAELDQLDAEIGREEK